MKLSRKLFALALVAVFAVVAVGGTTVTQASNGGYVDLAALAPDNPAAVNLYCDNPEQNYWYQVQKRDHETGDVVWIGSTVACGGWEAIRQFANANEYASTIAASNDGVVAGNRAKIWLADLDPISTYTP
jgi:hypothetical protein